MGLLAELLDEVRFHTKEPTKEDSGSKDYKEKDDFSIDYLCSADRCCSFQNVDFVPQGRQTFFIHLGERYI